MAIGGPQLGTAEEGRAIPELHGSSHLARERQSGQLPPIRSLSTSKKFVTTTMSRRSSSSSRNMMNV